MATESRQRSVTEQLETRGRQAGRRDYERQVRRRQPDRMTRFTRMVETSLRREPVTWGLVCLGVGAAIGAVWLALGRDK